ncbi:MAG: CoA transferase [Acidimicrobiia bacterium]
MAGALDGIRILDLSWGIGGPLGVLLMAEQGADVIKVEPPGGDPFRAYTGYAVWNRSRRSVTADLKSDDGRARFLRLAQTADVIVESFRPGVMDRLGVGHDALREANPRAILCSIPGYPPGHRFANRPGYDALVQASAGLQYEQPGWRLGPVFLHMPVPSMAAAFLVPTGVLAALIVRERTGRGQHVTTSLWHASFLYTTQIWQHVEKADAAFHDLMGKTYPPGVHQSFVFECANEEWLHLSVMSGLPPLKSQDEILGVPAAPTQVEAMSMDPDELAALQQRRRESFKKHDRDALVAELRAANYAVEPIITAEQALADPHPQLAANDMVVTLDDPALGTTTQTGIPIHLLGTPGAIRGPQPAVGQHDDEVWGSLDATAPPTPGPAPSDGRDTAAPPLDGVVVVDFGQYLAGPFGPMILSDLGATVVKVEPVAGDGMRMAGKPFVGCQRGKQSIALDLKNPRGLEVAKELVARADIVHHNMTKGIATKLGIDYASCREVKPDVVYCNTYAYGLDGPLSHFGGLDPLYQASSGLEYEAGATHTGNEPLYIRFGMTDTANAMLSVVGCLMALYHRERTGEGQELWTSLLDGGAVFSSDALLVDDRAVPRPRLDRGLNGIDACYRLYETQDGWIQIAAVTDAQFASLCGVLGVAELVDDRRFVTPAGRRSHREDLEALLAPRFNTKTSISMSLALDDAGVPNEVPLETHQGDAMLYDADNVALGLVAEYEHPTLGRLRQFGSVIDFSDTPGRIYGPPPILGEHTRAVLHWVGHDDAAVDTLREAGVVFEPDEHYTDQRAW